MGIRFNSFAIAGSSLITSFSDTFNRSPAATAGPNWMTATGFGSGNVMTTTFAIAGGVLSLSDSSVNQSQLYPEVMFPLIGAPNLNSKAQFSQFTWLSGNSVSGVRGLPVGPCCLAGLDTTGNFHAYCLQLNDEVGNFTINLQKFFSGSYTALFTTGTAAFAANSIIKLDAKPGTTSTVLNFYVNGVLLNTTTDSTNPLLTGVPGICRVAWVSTSSPGLGVETLNNFSCGPG